MNTPFDAAIFLTWSNWHTEPRSNRYHYATRFAREIPVLFLQRTGSDPDHINIEAVPDLNIEIVHVSEVMTHAQVEEFSELLYARGIKNPIYWIYDAHDYESLTDKFCFNFKVFHATEDYFTHSDGAPGLEQGKISEALKRSFSKFNLVVAVSDSVLSSMRLNGGYDGMAMVSENGSDTEFYKKIGAKKIVTRKTAIYQGAINSRLDFLLLHKLLIDMPSWDFWFCGSEDASIIEWQLLKNFPNLKYLGDLSPLEVGELMHSATVGIIPYKEDQWISNSLPLKAFEYVACGLPVVSVNITALKKYPKIFFIGNRANFSTTLEHAANTILDKEYINLRKEAAHVASYDNKYRAVKDCIQNLLDSKDHIQKSRLNVAILYDERWGHIETINEHLKSFQDHSNNNIYYVPATFSGQSGDPRAWNALGNAIDLSIFDVIIVHYSVRLSLRNYLLGGFAIQLENFSGLKILFIQDEYDTTETARSWMERIRFNIVYTCVPLKSLEFVYPSYRFPSTEFIPTLTGYIPEKNGIEKFIIPIADRGVRIGYRGRILSFYYGDLGREKYIIGAEVKKLANKYNVVVDIEVDDQKRVYGHDWYKFLGSVRGMLGTESGSNIFDFDGEIKNKVTRLLEKNPGINYEKVRKILLKDHEGLVRMNQISPKIFEAIRLRTALILFEGEYSGVIKPNIHYIPLAKDFSNIEGVFEKLEDIKYLKQLTDRAYQDVIASNQYSHEKFVQKIDSDIKLRYFGPSKNIIYSSPVIVASHSGEFKNILPKSSVGFSLSSQILGGRIQREQVSSLLEGYPILNENSSINEDVALVLEIPPLSQSRMQHLRVLFVNKFSSYRFYPLIRHVAWKAYAIMPSFIKNKIRNF